MDEMEAVTSPTATATTYAKTRKQGKKTPARHRHRATAACLHCRKARIRCVLDPDSRACVNCRDNEHHCVFDDKDGRKCRASAKSVETALMQRINDLEQQLQAARNDTYSRTDGVLPISDQPPPYTSPSGTTDPQSVDSARDQDTPSPEQATSVVTKLMPSSIRFDMASGRVRYFGSTTHMNVLSRMGSSREAERHNPHWPIALIVRDLSPETHAYLMDLYWNLHNSVIHMVHADSFSRDQENGGVEFYSTFLHLTMLATGFRYADKTREDIRRLALPGYASSTLHEKAKALAKLEIDKPGGIPSIQAFQLLGGLEFCCGNDETGWLFTGMCCRMVFDAGLHVDPSSLGLPERETQIRHMVLWACMTTDRLWSLYLGRPTTIKTSDIAPSCLSFDFGRLILCRPSWQEKKSTTRIYEALLRMMEHVSQLCDLRGPRPPKSTETYFKLAAIDQQLRDWYAALPPYLQWSQDICSGMPTPYFLLHAQYHAALILLHRPFVKYNENSESDINFHFTSLSRNSCIESARQIAIIFEEYRTRFELIQVYGTAVQHAGTSATALMGEIVMQTNAQVRAELLELLSSLRLSISLMSRNYQPAGHMTTVVDQFIRSVQSGNGEQPPKMPASASTNDENSTTEPNARVLTEGDMPLIPDFDGLPTPRKRTRVDTSYTFTPNCAGAQSPSGLPFLPSSFIESINAEDSLFADLASLTDANYQWEYPTGLQ